MKKIYFETLVLLGIVFFTFCACSIPGGAKDPQPEASTAPAIDWRSAGFAVSEEVEDKPELWLSECDLWEEDGIQIDKTSEIRVSFGELHVPRVCGSTLYRVATVTPKDRDLSKARWVLESYDTATGERTQKPFTRADLGIGEEETGLLIGMDVPAPDSFVFEYCRYEQTEEGFRMTGLEMIRTDLRGEAVRTDLWERYLEDGILKDESVERVYDLYWLYLQSEWLCDGKGNICRTAGQIQYGPTKLFVYGRGGERLLAYDAGEQETLGPSLRTADGEIICAVYDWRKKCYTFLWADTEQGEFRKVAEMKTRSNNINVFFGMQENTVYYESTEGEVVRWDIGTGKRTAVLRYEANGIARGNIVRLAAGEGGEPVLWIQAVYPETRQFVARLSGAEIAEKDHIRVADIATDTYHQDARWQVEKCAALSSQCIPGRIFSYETGGSDPEAHRDRIFAQLAAGEGPDILYVSREDMHMLEEKGLLADLRGLIPEEMLETLLPGVLELGTAGGKLAGITPHIYARTLGVSRDVWQGDTWRLEDLLELLEEGKLEPLWKFPYYTNWGELPVLLIMERLCENSFLINWEKRQCFFDDDRVIRLLRAGQRASGMTEEQEDVSPLLHGGNRLANIEIGKGFIIYEMLFEENGYCVGWPTEGSCGNYLEDDGFIVVNASSGNLEDIRNFLECLLSRNIQMTTALGGGIQSTRLSTESLVTDEKGQKSWYGYEMKTYEDGTTTLDWLIGFLDSCVACPRIDPKMENILKEELDPLYAGDRTPEQTAEILNNRIGLYLKETE